MIHYLKSEVLATNRYKKLLELFSLFFKTPLTEKEISILDELYSSHEGLLTTESRKHIRETLNISADHLNNYIKRLRTKKAIVDNSISPQLLINLNNDETKIQVLIELDVTI